MPLSLNDIQRLTIEALRRTNAAYVPAMARRVLPGQPEPDEWGGEIRQGKYYCEALMSRTQFDQLKDDLNAVGIWLTVVHFKPFGRSNNKFMYKLTTSELITRTQWLKQKAANSLRCTIELISDDPQDPTQGLSDVMRQLADELSLKAGRNGKGQPERYQLVVETENTRGRAIVRKQGDTARADEYAVTDRITGQDTPETGCIGQAVSEPSALRTESPPVAEVGPPPSMRASQVAYYGSGRCIGFIVCMPRA